MEKKDVWTISSLLNWTVNYFKSKKIESARLDAEVLLSHVLGQERIYLYVHFDEPMEKAELSKFREYVKKRAQHMPVAYIIGEKEFMGLPFKVTPDTLIPRPDTEILVENVLANADKQEAVKIADIGTGSGAIILSLLANLPKAQGKTVDIAAKAVEVAKENAQSLQVADRCEFFVGDLFAPFAERGDKFDIIVSNPPYIPQADIATLEADVRAYEPVFRAAAHRSSSPNRLPNSLYRSYCSTSPHTYTPSVRHIRSGVSSICDCRFAPDPGPKPSRPLS